MPDLPPHVRDGLASLISDNIEVGQSTPRPQTAKPKASERCPRSPRGGKKDEDEDKEMRKQKGGGERIVKRFMR